MGATGNNVEQRPFAGLTDKQVKFVREYPTDFSPTRAARKAGYRNPGGAGSKQLKNQKVQREILALLKPKLDEIELTTENVLRQLKSASVF